MSAKKSFGHSIKWAYASNWGERGLSTIFMVLLASLLGPREFGIVSIAIVYVNFLQMFLDQGLGAALIQRPELDELHLSSVFWANQAISILLVIVSGLGASWWAQKNHIPTAASLIFVFSLDIPLLALSNVQKTLRSREMDFKTLAICTNVSSLISGVVGISMAYAGMGVWALAGQQLSKDFLAGVILWVLSPWRPSLSFSWKHLKQLMSFSIGNFVAIVAIYADLQASSLILGLFFGPIALGLYRIADRVMNTVVTMAMSAIQTVSLPAFSRAQHDPEALHSSVMSCVRLTSASTMPALAGLFAVSPVLVTSLGAQWAPAAPVLRALCALGATMVLAYFAAPLLQALGRTREVAILEWGRTIVGLVVLVIIGIMSRGVSSPATQALAVALGRLGVGALIVAPVFVGILMYNARMSMRDLLSCVTPSAVSAAAVVTSVLLIAHIGWLASQRPVIALILEVAVGGPLGVIVLLGLDRQLRGMTLALARKRLLGLRWAKTAA